MEPAASGTPSFCTNRTDRVNRGRHARGSGGGRGRRRTAGHLVLMLSLASQIAAGCIATSPLATRHGIEPTFLQDSRTGWLPTRAVAGSPIEAKRVALGRSVNGVPLTMHVFGSGNDAVLIVGGIHGNEPTGAAVASRLEAFLRSHPEHLDGRTVGILAQANPDGLTWGTRANARGVDLNRNFPARDWHGPAAGEMHHGSRPASEPETLAVITAIETVAPARIVDIHSITHGRHCNNYDGSAGHLAELMSRFNGYPAASDVGYPTPGALGCWAGVDLDIPTVTLELPRHLSAEQCWRDNSAALLAFIGADGAGSAPRQHVQAGSH